MEEQKNTNLDELLDTGQAAEFLNVLPRVLEAWRLRAEGPNFVLYNTRSVRYRRRDLLTFIDTHTVNPEDYRSLPKKLRKNAKPAQPTDTEAA